MLPWLRPRSLSGFAIGSGVLRVVLVLTCVMWWSGMDLLPVLIALAGPPSAVSGIVDTLRRAVEVAMMWDTVADESASSKPSSRELR